MKITCDSIVRCGNWDCYHNRDGSQCTLVVVSIGADGKCAMCHPLPTLKSENDMGIKLTQFVPSLD